MLCDAEWTNGVETVRCVEILNHQEPSALGLVIHSARLKDNTPVVWTRTSGK
jgi:hypothetical protein